MARARTAAFVHYSALHLAANLAGAALVGALGVAARVPRAMALRVARSHGRSRSSACSLRPDLLHYGGLSGVLHAGVAVVGVHLVARRPRRAAR